MAEAERCTGLTAEERAREVVLQYRTGDPDARPPLTTMIAQAIRAAEQGVLERMSGPAPEQRAEPRRQARA